MDERQIVLAGLPTNIQRPLRELTGLLTGLYGEALLGLSAYGPALDGSAHHEGQGIESVMVLSHVELSSLRRLSEHGAKLGGLGLAAPLAMTPEYVSASLDSFPLELLEIQQRHVTIFGRDYFENLPLQPEHVRLECEREFKRILMRMRQGVLAAAGRDEVLTELAADVGRQLARTLRGFLWLKGNREYLDLGMVASRCEAVVGKPLDGVRSLSTGGGGHAATLFAAVYEDVEALAARSDGK